MLNKLKVRMRVRRGFRLLNKENPNWREKVDLTTLNLAFPEKCILGQVYGSYERGKYDLCLHGFDAKKYGFDTTFGEDFEPLQKEWERKLVKV